MNSSRKKKEKKSSRLRRGGGTRLIIDWLLRAGSEDENCGHSSRAMRNKREDYIRTGTRREKRTRRGSIQAKGKRMWERSHAGEKEREGTSEVELRSRKVMSPMSEEKATGQCAETNILRGAST